MGDKTGGKGLLTSNARYDTFILEEATAAGNGSENIGRVQFESRLFLPRSAMAEGTSLTLERSKTSSAVINTPSLRLHRDPGTRSP